MQWWRHLTLTLVSAACSMLILGAVGLSPVLAQEGAADSVVPAPKKHKPVKRKKRATTPVAVVGTPGAPSAATSTTPGKPATTPATTANTAAPASSAGASDMFTLNFSDADIRLIIEAVSKYTGRNFIVDPQVKGKVTIISQRPMHAKQIYEVFLSILKVHGYAAVPGKDVIKIVPDANAKQEPIDNLVLNRQTSESDEIVTHVIEVRHVDASQLVPILRPLVPQRGHLAAVPTSNVIIISDSASNIARLVALINRIDQATGDEIEVIPLQHAAANEVMRILSQLDSKDPKAPQERTKIVADERTNSLLISGDKSARLRTRALIVHLDTPVELGGNTHVVYLRNAVAKDLVPVLTGISQAKGAAAGAAAKPVGDLNIQADQNTNALVITAPPEVFRSLKAVIQQLDVRRAQVLVEAVIAEVSNDVTRELGVQWAVDGRQSGNAVGLVNFSVGTPITAYANLAAPPNPIGFNVGFGNFGASTQIGALLSMLAGDAYTNILSTPSLVTLDNEEAQIVVGQNVPFVTGSFSNTGGSATPSNPFQTIERKDVGLTLKIKPQINEGDAIKLDVTQEVSSIASSSAAADIITNKRSIKTSVVVDDGQIVVLGGLIEDNVREAEQKVPGLGDIPLLGWLFRYQRTTKVKTNLMVFLHPSIMKDEKALRAITSEKYNFIRAQQLRMREKGVNLMADDVAPLMPELQEIIKLPPSYDESRQRQELSQPPAETTKRARKPATVKIPEEKLPPDVAPPPAEIPPPVIPTPTASPSPVPQPTSTPIPESPLPPRVPSNEIIEPAEVTPVPEESPTPAPLTEPTLPLLPPASDDDAGRIKQ